MEIEEKWPPQDEGHPGRLVFHPSSLTQGWACGAWCEGKDQAWPMRQTGPIPRRCPLWKRGPSLQDWRGDVPRAVRLALEWPSRLVTLPGFPVVKN